MYVCVYVCMYVCVYRSSSSSNNTNNDDDDDDDDNVTDFVTSDIVFCNLNKQQIKMLLHVSRSADAQWRYAKICYITLSVKRGQRISFKDTARLGY